HNPTQALCWKLISVFFNELKPHGFWLAKNTVDLHRFRSGVLLILGGDLFEGHG
ncbi:hypothetical protein GGQ68_004961, partial [Sagittula marina]|nr:hypothetical protein [Sagittula marina]